VSRRPAAARCHYLTRGMISHPSPRQSAAADPARRGTQPRSGVAAGILPAVEPGLPARRKNLTHCQCRLEIFESRKNAVAFFGRQDARPTSGRMPDATLQRRRRGIFVELRRQKKSSAPQERRMPLLRSFGLIWSRELQGFRAYGAGWLSYRPQSKNCGNTLSAFAFGGHLLGAGQRKFVT